ncbi:hypothetical protein ASG57_22370 [Bradyrhizobium sp. Leaf396]|nr:hypothetical protein ASG57_22370 [Bradyrhizobium sp. Leaf396]
MPAFKQTCEAAFAVRCARLDRSVPLHNGNILPTAGRRHPALRRGARDNAPLKHISPSVISMWRVPAELLAAV